MSSINNRTQSKHKRIYNGIFKRRVSNFNNIIRWRAKILDADEYITEEDCYNYIYKEFLRRASEGIISKNTLKRLKEPILTDLLETEDKTYKLEELKGKRMKIYNYYMEDSGEIMVDVEFAGGFEDSYPLPR